MTQTDQQNVPKLRFPGFEGEWKTHKLADGVELISGQHLATSEYNTNKGEVPYFTGPSDFVDSEALVSKWTNDSGKVARKGDVLITVKGSGVGELLHLSLKKAAMGRQLMAIRERGFDTSTIFQLLVTRKQKFVALASGNMIPGLSRSDILGETVRLPTLPEQRKIAAFLGAVDTKIAQLARKKALLEDYKKGCMQQLFSQTVRFKDEDGNDFPDWEEKRLGEVLTIGSGRDYKHLGEGNVPVHGTGGLMTHVDDFLYDGESVCIGRKGTIDKPVFLTGKFWTVDTLFYTHSFKKALPRFIFAIFQQINWQIHNEASGVPSLSKATIERLKISLPHPDEQRKIANFLSALDRKIQLVDQELTHTRTFKQGLLQQMFV